MTKPGKTSNRIGQQGELLAKQFLLKQGLQLRQQNYRCRHGELDLIMDDGQSLVFIEVKARKSSAFGSAAEAVNPRKQQKLILAAEQYLSEHRLHHKHTRFDVVTLISNQTNLSVEQWIKDAFQG